VGLNEEPQVKSCTRRTEVLTWKGRTSYKTSTREHQV